MPMMCLCPRLSTSSFLRFSMHFPSVFHSMSYSGRRVNIHESFSHDSCSHRLCFGHIQRPSEASLDQLLGHGSYTRCVHNLLDKSVKAVSSLVSARSCHSDIHSAFTAKIEFGETIGYSTMSLTLRLKISLAQKRARKTHPRASPQPARGKTSGKLDATMLRSALTLMAM